MYSQISANKRNTVLLMIGFILFMGLIGGAFAYIENDISIAIWVVGFSLIYACFQYFFATRLAVSMSGGKKIEKKDNPRLYNIVENLTITTGLPMPEVYIIDDPSPNAFATGRDPEHAIVAATTGLLSLMNDKELQAVMAHEISHVKNYDIRVSMIVYGLTCAIALISDIGVRLIWRRGRRSRDDDNPIIYVIALVCLILAPLVSAIARMAVSREREYLADMSAAQITRYPEGMISALRKLSGDHSEMAHTSSSMETMYFRSSGMKELFSTHPSIENRIKRLEDAKTKF